MYKSLLYLRSKCAIALAIFMLPTFVLAAAPTINGMLTEANSKGKFVQTEPDFTNGSYPELVGRFIGIFLGILGVIFTVLLIYAGYLWFTAQGDAAALEKSKDIMMRAVIGLLIVTSAYVVTYFVTTALTKGDYLK